MIENGFALLPIEAPWLADYLAVLTAFPDNRSSGKRGTPALPWQLPSSRTPPIWDLTHTMNHATPGGR